VRASARGSADRTRIAVTIRAGAAATIVGGAVFFELLD
jgi:hypothetical protein